MKVSAVSCPPLALFIDNGRGNAHWAKTIKQVTNHTGCYIELGNDGERYAIIPMDAVLWLLMQRNRTVSKLYIPKQPVEKTLLHKWQYWVRLAPAFYTSTKLGYSTTASETTVADEHMQIDELINTEKTCSPIVRSSHNGKRKTHSPSDFTPEMYAETAKKRIRARKSETDQQEQDGLADLLVEAHASGMMDLKDRIEKQMTPDRRLYAHYCSRSTMNSRDRLRNAFECESTTATATIQDEEGIRAENKAPPRFKTQAAIDAFLKLAEEEWSRDTALSNEYESCVDACEAGFALSTQCGRFWGRVRTRARESVGQEDGVPANVLDTLPSSQKSDPTHIRHVIEEHVGACFDTRAKNERHRIHHEFGDYVCEQPQLIPNTRREQRESDLGTESYGEIRRKGTDTTTHMQPIAAADVENTVTFRNRLNPDGNAAMSDAVLSAKLKQGAMSNAMLLGVEREILTEDGSCKRMARFLDPRLLAAQWVLQNEKDFSETEGNQTIQLAMEPWMDGPPAPPPCVPISKLILTHRT